MYARLKVRLFACMEACLSARKLTGMFANKHSCVHVYMHARLERDDGRIRE